VAAIGAAVLVGWIFNITSIKTVATGLTSMKANTVQLTTDFGSPSMFIQTMVTDGTRRYAGGAVMGGASSVFIYDLGNVGPGATPIVTLNGGNGIPMGVVFTMAIANDVLVLYSGGKVLSFSGAKTLTGSAQGVNLTNDMTQITRVALSAKTGLLYTLGSYKGNQGMQVWKSPASTPSLQAEMRMGITQPADIVLYEP
jgi:hypothetical protein